MASIDDRINGLDASLFDHVVSQTLAEDKRSLLALQAAVRASGPYTYLEIGSFRGGSLQPYLVDPVCERIISIDPRVSTPSDARSGWDGVVQYEDNSTEHMRALLAAVPGAQLDKLITIDASPESIDPASLAGTPALCFIDGEHTSRAALRDAIFCIQAAPQATIVFHDRGAVRAALGGFLGVYGGVGYQLPELLFVIERSPRLCETSAVLRERVQRRRLWDAANRFGLAGPVMSGVALLRRS
jgi:hypothetical protein